MFLTRRNKQFLIILAAAIILFSILYFFTFSYSFIDIKNKNFIKNYGWQVQSGSLVSADVIMSNEYLKDYFNQMKINASKSIGLNPESYRHKNIKVYSYSTSKTGIYNNLMIGIWTYKNNVICAYIFHTDNNYKIKCWPLNAEYSEIKKDLVNLQSKVGSE